MRKKRYVLLDRDGTIIAEKNYLSDPDGIEILPGVLDGLKNLQKLGLGLLIITNQSGIGRKYFNLATLEKIHQKLIDLLLKDGVILDDIYFCPHTPEDNCLCRKPKIELVRKAITKHNFDPKLCFVVGDNKADIELGKNIGATTILVRTGYGEKIAQDESIKPNFVVRDLLAAADVIEEILSKYQIT